MKLPSINQGAPQQLTKQDVQAPLVEANSRKAVYSAAGATINDAIDRYVKRETDRQVQEATLAMQQRAIDFEKSYGSKLEFDPMDPELVANPNFNEAMQTTGINDVNAKVPAYRIIPELRAKMMQDSATEFSSIISDETTRNKWMFETESYRLNQYLKDSADASKQQIVYTDIQTTQAIEGALRDGDYGAAKLAITTSQWTQEKQTEALNGITRQEQTDFFNEVLKNQNVGQMDKALKALLDPNDPNSSHLTEQEEKVFANQLRSEIKSQATKTEGNVEGSKAVWKDQASKLISALNDGQRVDPTQFASTLKVMSKIDPVKALNMVSAFQTQGAISQISQMPLHQQQEFVSDPTVPMTAQEAYQATKINQAVSSNMSAIKSDTMRYMKDKAVMDIPPIDFGSPEGLAATLSARIGAYDQAQEMYKYSSGYLDDNEALMFNDMIERAKSPEAKLAVYSSIQQALGDKRAGVFYEQLKNKNLSGSDMIAGQLATEGKTQEALTVVKGSQLRRDNPDLVIKDAKDVIDTLVIETFGNAFAGNPIQRDQLRESAYNAYASLSASGSDYGSVDRKRAQAAIKMTTGGLIEYNGSMLQAPKPDMSESSFEKWIETRTPMMYEGMNVLQTPSEVKQLIVDGDWKLRGVGKGIYNVVDNTGAIVSNKDGATAFRLVYDPDISIEYTAPTPEQLQEIDRRKKAETKLFSGAGLDEIINLLEGLNLPEVQ